MEVEILKAFFMWCTIINGGVLLFWTVCVLCLPDLVYRIQSKWIPISRQAFDIAIYSFIGIFKVFFLMFNLVPYLALTLIG
jgi:hypothetical protein